MSRSEMIVDGNNFDSKDSANVDVGKSEPVIKFKRNAKSSKPTINGEKEFAQSSKYYLESLSSQGSHLSAAPSSIFDANDIPVVDAQTYAKLSKMVPKSHWKYINECMSKLAEKNFTKWLHLLHCNFNILIQGFGSKIALIEEFRLLHLEHFNHVIIKGYYPGLNLKSVISTLSENIDFVHSYTPNNFQQFARSFIDYFETTDLDLFVVVPSIDSAFLRVNKLSKLFVILATHPRIHFIASVDHINADLLWNQESRQDMKWVCFNCTTFENYSIETSFENNLLQNSTGSLAVSSLISVTKSITPNAKRILEIIINFYLENPDAKNSGMVLQQCYLLCREQFLVNSDLALRLQLTEFIDHGLISMKKTLDGSELVCLNVTRDVMRSYLESEKKA